jgi:AcrR family transcriptional regulator
MKCPFPEVNPSVSIGRVMAVTYTPMVPKAETVAPATSRGRPRAAGRTDEILQATTELIDEVGYDRLRIQDVADRAGAGLATIYRRWPTKQALVADSIRHKSDGIDPVQTGEPVADLAALFRAIAEHACGRNAEFLPGLLAAMRTEPELADAFRTHFIERISGRIRQQLVLLLGADHESLDLLADLVPGVLIFRSLMPGATQAEPAQFVDEALAVVLAAQRARFPDAAS